MGPAFHAAKPIRGGRPLDGLFHRLMADPLWVAQAKLDGQRAIWDGGLWSRTGNRIHAPELVALLAGLPVLDGEYVPTRGQRGVGTYWVFDLPDHVGTLAERWPCLTATLSALVRPGLLQVCPAGVSWSTVASCGWEGVVLKKLTSTYPRGSSPNHTTPSWVKYRAAWL